MFNKHEFKGLGPDEKYLERIRVDVDRFGNKKPLEFTWQGKTIQFDQVGEPIRAASTKKGGFGMRYLCKVKDTVFYLYDENGRFFIEF